MTDNFNIPSFCCIFVSRLVTSIETRNVHICLFSERYDFCDFIGCSSVSTNFVKHRTRFYSIIKRKPNIHVLIKRGGSCSFQPCFRGGSVIFVPKGGGGPCVFHQPHFQMLRPTAPPPPPSILFDQSLMVRQKTFLK